MENRFDFESFLYTNRYLLAVGLLGLILIGLGAFYVRNGLNLSSTKVEVLSEVTEGQGAKEIVVEVGGAVLKPGVYTLAPASRIDDALVLAGGLAADADRDWVEKTLNRATKIADGQKIYIPKIGESTTSSKGITSTTGGQSSLTNINSASQKQLEDLPGIGPVYAQNIIEHRPYSSVEELLGKSALKKSVYEKIKDLVSVY